MRGRGMKGRGEGRISNLDGVWLDAPHKVGMSSIHLLNQHL